MDNLIFSLNATIPVFLVIVVGILAGDGVLNYAYEICANSIVNSKYPERSAKALKVLSEKAGVYGMVGGQTVDVSLTGEKFDIDTLNFIYELKTGALIEASLMCGAILAGACDSDVRLMEETGRKIGLAFQIQDDILDVTSTTEELGKPVYSDEKNEKTTYVTVYGIKKAMEIVENISGEAIRNIETIKNKNTFLKELVQYLITRKK